MYKPTILRQLFQSIPEAIGRVISFISGAVTRIFGPTDDDYPKTGVQPFEGDPAKDNKQF
ncbi:hypothetical protein [Iningainema tapete]|uniref:Isochorismate synthase n=1 Tax=Iningainema tapete BLCC-T55 TaxID=2748662 RepID=A0A8J6XV27_9CYAN|nr:hypothetical protein [Iningainema tapete]MBD2774238.1 hypothetical protein [Iningainema tapete BLCC-T55]